MARAKRASDVLQHGLRGEAPLRSSRRRDDAVRAEERAAVLDLDERPRPLNCRAAVGDAVDLDARQGRQRAIETASLVGRTLAHDRGQLREETVLHPVVDEPRRGIGRRERFASDLDGTARHDNLRIRVGVAGAPDGLARLLVGGRSHGAGVDDDEVGCGGAIDDPNAALAKQSGGRFHLGLVDLAAEVRDRCRLDAGHHSCGFVLMRKPIVPTSAAIA